MKILNILKNIFSIIGLIAVIIIAVGIPILIWRKNEDNSNNSVLDVFGFSGTTNNGSRIDNSISDTIERINSNSERIGDELDGSRNDIEQLRQQNDNDRDRTGRLDRVRKSLEDIIERIRTEGVTKD